MDEITFYSLESIGVVEPEDDLPEIILNASEREGLKFKDRDVIIITSKVVSMYEGRVVDLEDVEPSRKAKSIARTTGMLEEEVELVLEEGEVLATIPVRNSAKISCWIKLKIKRKQKKL